MDKLEDKTSILLITLTADEFEMPGSVTGKLIILLPMVVLLSAMRALLEQTRLTVAQFTGTSWRRLCVSWGVRGGSSERYPALLVISFCVVF